MGKGYSVYRVKVYGVFLLGFTCLTFTGCKHNGQLPYYVSADFTPVWANADLARSLHRIAPFSFVNQDGDTVSEKTFAGTIYVANFFFASCPGICKLMVKNLLVVQDAFKEDSSVQLISHSVTPDHDSVPVLKRYAEEHHALSGKWHFVTGSKDAIYAIARQSYFADEAASVPDADGDFLHTEKVFLVDGNRHIRGVYNGALPAEMERLKADIRMLKK